VLQPYRLIKDHRTSVEVTNTSAFLDGRSDTIDPMVEAALAREGEAP
jgi:protein subunit release factor B